MSFYILVLSCIPCHDATAAAGKDTVTISTLAAHTDHESQPDACSPLCICSCCNVQVTPVSTVVYHFYHQRIMIAFPALPLAPLPAAADNIWQPPRLG